MDRFIEHHLAGVSRTYALVIPMLPAPLAEKVGLAYLLMRVVDTLEDAGGLSDAQRVAHMSTLMAALRCEPLGRSAGGISESAGAAAATALADAFRGVGDTDAERGLMGDSDELVRRVRPIEPRARDAIIAAAAVMASGVERLLGRAAARRAAYPAVADVAELREYCYYVAGSVGEMLCALIADHLRAPGFLALRPVAVELGIGLQLVNILKDAAADAAHGRRYLPPASGAPAADSRLAALKAARESLQRGVEFVLALPAASRGLRLFCGLPLAWGAMTLAASGEAARAAKIGRAVLRATVDQFQSLAGDDRALRGWLCDLLDGRPVVVA